MRSLRPGGPLRAGFLPALRGFGAASLPPLGIAPPPPPSAPPCVSEEPLRGDGGRLRGAYVRPPVAPPAPLGPKHARVALLRLPGPRGPSLTVFPDFDMTYRQKEVIA